MTATLDTFSFYTSYPKRFDGQGFYEWIMTRTADPQVTYAMIDLESKEVVGCSCMFDASEANRKLEIGYTWIAENRRQTWVNPTSKLLMLSHAFETLGCNRVQLKTDSRNLQSRAAILKLGASFEGLLRQSFVMPDGFVRDTAYFSIIRAEWPDDKQRILDRLKSLY